jgi:DNA-directed RNA polymerase subunit RPC12/RpoP
MCNVSTPVKCGNCGKKVAEAALKSIEGTVTIKCNRCGQLVVISQPATVSVTGSSYAERLALHQKG